MHRLASVHLHSFSHYWSRLSVTIVTATGHRTTLLWHLSDFGERENLLHKSATATPPTLHQRGYNGLT